MKSRTAEARRRKKWLVLLVEVDEDKLVQDGFPKGAEISSLPDALKQMITKLAPHSSLDLQKVYLLTDRQKDAVLEYVEAHSLPYHEYAVRIRGERCVVKGCDLHHECMVINLHDRRKKAKGAE
jgi:hypothetical protein